MSPHAPLLRTGNSGKADALTQGAADVQRRALSGMRAVMLLNYGTLPLSFLTNVAFGRVSALALGYASVVQLFVGGFLTFFVLGGPKVFVRYVPAIDPRHRTSFLASYGLVVVALFLATSVLIRGLLPGWTTDLLREARRPAPAAPGDARARGGVWAFRSTSSTASWRRSGAPHAQARQPLVQVAASSARTVPRLLTSSPSTYV